MESNRIIESLLGEMNRFQSLKLMDVNERLCVEENTTVDTTFDGKPGLKCLSISVDSTTAVTILRAIANECRLVKRLCIFMNRRRGLQDVLYGDIVDVISSFKQVKSLTLNEMNLNFALLRIMVKVLPELTSLRLNHIGDFEYLQDEISQLFKSFPNLREFKIQTLRNTRFWHSN